MIVLDDDSSDDTANIIHGYIDKYSFINSKQTQQIFLLHLSLP